MITRRSLLTAAAGIAGASVLASCSSSEPDGGSEVPTRTDGLPDLTWSGTITMGAQAYTPAVEGVNLAPGSRELQEFGKAAEAFTALYPNITISFLGSEYTYDIDQMKTAATGGQLPDVWWQQAVTVKTDFPQGVALNLQPYMEQPNPFIEGNERWRDVLNDSVYAVTAADADTIYTVNGDFVGTAFFYNVRIFEEAGVEPPTDWDGLLEVCRTLQQQGITPLAMDPYNGGYGWFSRIFYGNCLGEEQLKAIDAFSPDEPGITTVDVAVAYHQGLIDPRQNPAVLDWWPVAKELFQYSDPTILQLPPSPPVGSPSQATYFASEQVAMIYDGTWAPGAVTANGADFEVGSFPWPVMAGSSQYATDYNSANAVGGPSAAFQFNVSSERANSTLREEGKLDAVVAWLQFFSTPEWNEAICNENGSFLPTFKGTTPPDSMSELAALSQQPIYAVSGGTELSAEAADQVSRMFQGYLLDQVSMDEVKEQFPVLIDDALEEFTRNTPIDFDAYS